MILDEPLRPACAAAKTLNADDGAPFEAPQGSSSIENWKVGEYVSLGFCRRHTRSELVLFGVAFTGSGERAIHPTHQRASPAAARTSARQNSLRSHLCRKRSVHALMPLPQEQFDARNDYKVKL